MHKYARYLTQLVEITKEQVRLHSQQAALDLALFQWLFEHLTLSHYCCRDINATYVAQSEQLLVQEDQLRVEDFPQSHYTLLLQRRLSLVASEHIRPRFQLHTMKRFSFVSDE